MKNEQTKQISTFPKSEWKIWLWGIILFLVIFMVIKTVSKLNTKEATATVAKFNEVDVLPSFPNGERAFGNYLQHNIHNKSAANGRVIASFVVSKNGSIQDVRILRGLNAEADQEVVRVLEESPKWNPGIQKGKAVNVAYTMPVNFTR
ncbi:MAG: energy transducer TonB [Sphingobacteriaceae bacterium]|nr:MAG: energy transducer TonB [Sphingobacteriaceae bacterium]